MPHFILTRLATIASTFLGLAFLTFVLIRLVPGDAVEIRVGERGISPERHAELLHDLGLDKPIYVQFLDYLTSIAQGDFGVSMVTQRPVLSEFGSLFPATLELSLFAITFAIAIGVPAGIAAAIKRGTLVDYGIMGISLIGYSMPVFWWGILLIMAFSLNLHWTPVSGRISLEFFFPKVTGFMVIDSLLSGEAGAFVSSMRHLILPTIVLGTNPLAVIARMTRSSLLEVLNEEYIRTARAKGLSEARVIFVHALRNALIPVVTVVGLQVGTLMGGAILTETIFSWPGVGNWLVGSIGRRDYAALQGGVLLIGAAIMCINLTVDFLYGVINPRVRHVR